MFVIRPRVKITHTMTSAADSAQLTPNPWVKLLIPCKLEVKLKRIRKKQI